MGRTSRADDSMVERLRAKLVKNCGIARHPNSNAVMDILSIEKKSSKGEVTYEDPCRNTINIFLQNVGTKEGVSLIPGRSARPQGARRQMAGFSVRNFISQVCTLILSNFLKGNFEIHKDLP